MKQNAKGNCHAPPGELSYNVFSVSQTGVLSGISVYTRLKTPIPRKIERKAEINRDVQFKVQEAQLMLTNPRDAF